MGKHEIALSYIEKGVKILSREYETRFTSDMGDDEERIRFATVVATVFHNAGVEYEYANDFSNSLIHYNKALRVSQIHMG